jgi:hypothetical protein
MCYCSGLEAFVKGDNMNRLVTFHSYLTPRGARWLGLLLALILIFLSGAAWAYQNRTAPSSPQAPSFEVGWRTFDNGLYSATAGTFTMVGTAGQPDARSVTGGTFTISGGFWQPSMNYQHVFLPVTLR